MAKKIYISTFEEAKRISPKGEMQQLWDKLTVAERTPTYEAQLKEKYHLRLKLLEEGLKMSSGSVQRTNSEGKSVSNGSSCRQSLGGADNILKASPNGLLTRRTSSFQFRSPLSSGSSTVLKHAKGTSKSFDGGSRVSCRLRPPSFVDRHRCIVDCNRDKEISGVSISLHDVLDLTHLRRTIAGPVGIPYEGGTFAMDIQLLSMFPDHLSLMLTAMISDLQ
ncbi:Microtubule-associated protein 70-3 [Platanthera zijinensis]|uniref:Microtubule-associated protein 70-3 n=1 Tax=Platanthera zijinensis TaxID=2320716 RepID=A0AAP0BX41_9ASPA